MYFVYVILCVRTPLTKSFLSAIAVNKKYFQSNKTETWKQKVNTIRFDSIHPDDEGIYECHAYNEPGGSKRLINVEVRINIDIFWLDKVHIRSSCGT